MNEDVERGDEGTLDSTKSMPPSSDESGSGRFRQLDPGDVLGDRFTIIRFLARGGMGEVYEAADRHLQNKHCALKILRAEIASDPAIRQRFEREVLLAREVTHPNVCPTFDIFRMEGPRGPVMFLTMKLLRGESLSTRIKRGGPFDIESAWPIVRQMADALDAAHRAGVIHRDFKPSNVMLETANGAPRVAITDFGLSRAYEADESAAETGRISGTIGYIAPELLQGGTATPASDVYAFGVVVHEMLTGKRPLGKPGKFRFDAPGKLVEGLPRAWDRLVMGCLQAEVAKRFQSAGEAISGVDTRSASTRSVRLRVPSAGQRKWGLVLAAAVLGFGAWMMAPSVDSVLHPLPSKRFVALMAWPVEPNSEYRPLLKSVLDATGARLSRAEAKIKEFMVISASDVAGKPAPQAPKEADECLGVNLVLAASAKAAPGGVAVSLKVLEAGTQKVLRADEVRASESELGALPEKVAVMGAKLLDVPVIRGRLQERDELANIPGRAYQHYAAAEELAAQPNNTGLEQAIEHYQKAVEIDPRFALGYARLSIAYTRRFVLTHDAAVLMLATRNSELAMRYNPDSVQSQLSRAEVDVNSGRTQQAIDELTQALKLSPGDAQVLSYKTRALRDLERRAEEEEVYRATLKERPNFWPAYLDLGQALFRQKKYTEAASVYAQGAAVAPRVAELQTGLGAVYLAQDRLKDAEGALLKSVQLRESEFAYLNLGTIAFKARDYRRALEYYVKARDLGPPRDSTFRNIGDCYAVLGDRARVTENYRKAADILGESLRINPKPGRQWMNLAFYQAKLGHSAEAEKSMQTAEARGAGDVSAQFKKAQVLALLRRNEESVLMVIDCMKKGLSPAEVELALDLKEVRADPRYKRQAALSEPIK